MDRERGPQWREEAQRMARMRQERERERQDEESLEEHADMVLTIMKPVSITMLIVILLVKSITVPDIGLSPGYAVRVLCACVFLCMCVLWVKADERARASLGDLAEFCVVARSFCLAARVLASVRAGLRRAFRFLASFYSMRTLDLFDSAHVDAFWCGSWLCSCRLQCFVVVPFLPKTLAVFLFVLLHIIALQTSPALSGTLVCE